MGGFNDSRIFAAGGLGSISGTVATLTTGLGLQLGEERYYNGVKYRLFFNAGGASITAGYVASPLPLNGGPYSVTVSTASGSYHGIGCCVAHNATVPTASYFWGAQQGYLASGLVAVTTTLTTGNLVQVGTDGKVNGGAAIASGFISGNIAIGVTVNGPTAGTVNVRQGSVYLSIV